MRFGAKLRQAMKDLNLSQAQVCSMTGKSKASISQYLSNTQLPSEETQRGIAVALGLDPEYFTLEKKKFMPKEALMDGKIQRLLPDQAAEMMGLAPDTVRTGLQQGVFPWGYAIKTSEHRWAYFINARRFAEIEGVVL